MHVPRVGGALDRHRSIARRLRTAAVIVSLTLLLLSVASTAQVVRVGFYENPPKLYTNDAGEIVGFFPMIIEYIAEQEGWTLEYVSGDWTECLSRLEAGEIDLMPDVGYSEQRAAIYGFAAEPLFINWGIIYASPDTAIESIPDLAGKRIAVMKGSIHTEGEQGIKAMLSQFDIQSTYVEVPNYAAVLAALQADEADAGVVNRLFGLANEDQYGVRQTPIVFNPRELRFAYPIGSAFGATLADIIDEHVRSMKADSQSAYYTSIYTYLLGGEAPDVERVLWAWVPWALGGGSGTLVLILGLMLYYRRRQRRLGVTLSESEVRFDAMFEQAAVGFAIVDPNTQRFVRVNPTLCAMAGYTELELLQLSIQDLVHPEDLERDRPAIRRVAEGQLPGLDTEERCMRKDGTEIWMALSLSMVRSSRDKPLYWIGVMRDITDQKRAEVAQRESEERLRSIIEQSIDGIVLVDSNGIVVEWNQGQAQITGLTADQVIGIPFWDVQFQVIPSEKRVPHMLEILRETTQTMLHGEESPWAGRFIDQEIQRVDGTRRMIQIGSFPIDLGERRMVGNVTRDITDQKRAEQELAEHRENLERLVVERTEALNTAIEAANAAMFRLNLLTDEVERDERWFEIVGITKDQFDGTHDTWRRLVHPDDLPGAEARIADAVASASESMRHEYRIVRPDGEIRVIETRARILRDETGKATMLIGMNIDITDRRRTEEALARERERLDMAIDYASAAMFEHDLKADRLTVSDHWYEMFDIPEEGFDGRIETWRERIHPDDLARVRQVFNDAYLQPDVSSLHCEFRVQRRNGETRYVESRSTIVRDDVGKAIATMGLNIDITDRRHAEEALRENEAFLRSIIEHMPIDFFALDKDRRYTMQSPTSREAVGDVLGQKANEVEAPESLKQQWATELDDVFSGEITQREYDVPTKSGDVRTYISSMAPVRVGGEIVSVIGTSIDITNRKRSEERIRQLSRVIEESPVSVVITNTEGAIEYVNPRFSEVTGYTSEEAVGENSRILKSGHQPESFYREMWNTILAGNEWRGELCNKTKTGDLLWELASIVAIRDESEAITHFVAIKEDITERKHAAWELEQAKRDADSANQAKSDFLANMSHELRTPLNAVIGFSEVLEDSTFGELNDKQHQYVGNILQSGRHLLSLINDILDLSKVEAGKMELDLSNVDISRLLFESQVFVQEKVHQHGIRLETNLSKAVNELVIQADERKLKQILFNLLSNAAKFTPDGGSIDVEGRIQDSDLLLAIHDTGIGMKPEDLVRVFDEFEQLDASYAKAQQGTGLGLALTKRLVELHGGRIWAESEGEGLGSTFTFTLPLTGVGESEGG